MASKRSRTIEDSSEDDYDSYASNDEVDSGYGDDVEEDSAMSDVEGDPAAEDEEDDEDDAVYDGDDRDEDELSAVGNINDEDVDNDDDEVESELGESPRHMTARQRNKREGKSANIGLIDLAEIEGTSRPKKAQLSAEEQRIKRAEMARRRRNLSQQRLEEEKKETLDKLLKKRAKKVRGGAEEEGPEAPKISKSRLHPRHPAYLTWTSTREKATLSMTEERAKRDGLIN